MFLSYTSLGRLNCSEFLLKRSPMGRGWWTFAGAQPLAQGVASWSERERSPLAKQVTSKGRGWVSRVTPVTALSPTADRQAHGQRGGKSCFDWKPLCLAQLWGSWWKCPAFPFILNAHSSSWPQWSATMATAGKTQEAKRALSTRPAAFSSSRSSPQNWTRTVPTGVACGLLRVRTGPSAQLSQLLLGQHAVQQNTGHAQTPLGPSEDGQCWGEQKGELMSRVQPTADCLPVPPDLVPETTRRKDATLCIPAATCRAPLTDLGPWPFWLSGTGAAREKETSLGWWDRESRLQPSPHKSSLLSGTHLPEKGCVQPAGEETGKGTLEASLHCHGHQLTGLGDKNSVS
jgi:hypothetical protein